MDADLRERRIEDDAPGGGAATATAPNGGDLSNSREAGDDILDRWDDAINRALSVDAEQFLRATRQHGGQ